MIGYLCYLDHLKISNIFKAKYEALYNSQSTAATQNSALELQLSHMQGEAIAIQDVEAAIRSLHCGKADGCFEGLSSDCFTHAPDTLHAHICFFNTRLVFCMATSRRLSVTCSLYLCLSQVK